MKTKMLLTLLFLTALVAAGSAQNMGDPGSTGQMRDYSYSEKDKFVKDMRKDLKSVDKELKSLGKEADKLQNDSGRNAKQQIDALKAQSSELKSRIDKAKDTPESQWNDTKSGITRNYDSLKSSVDRIRTDIGSEAAPERRSGGY